MRLVVNYSTGESSVQSISCCLGSQQRQRQWTPPMKQRRTKQKKKNCCIALSQVDKKIHTRINLCNRYSEMCSPAQNQCPLCFLDGRLKSPFLLICVHMLCAIVSLLNDGPVWPHGHRLSPLITWR